MTILSLKDSMTYLCLILNGLFFYIVMGLGPPEFYWRGGEDNVFLLFVWRLPVLINIFVLLNMVPGSFGQKKGVMTCLSLFGSVVVFVGTIFVWRAEWESFRSVDGGGSCGLVFYVTHLVNNHHCCESISTTEERNHEGLLKTVCGFVEVVKTR